MMASSLVSWALMAQLLSKRVPSQPGLSRKSEFLPASHGDSDHQKDGTSTERSDQQDEQMTVLGDQGRKSVEDGSSASHAYTFWGSQGPSIMTMTAALAE
jgi:hypothetical protein